MLTVEASYKSDDLLLPPKKTIGHVLSVHKGYLNIAIDDGLITLFQCGSPAVPFGIAVNMPVEWTTLELASKQTVRLFDGKLEIEGCVTIIGIDTCDGYSCLPQYTASVTNEHMAERLGRLHSLCQTRVQYGGIAPYLGDYELRDGNVIKPANQGLGGNRLCRSFEALVAGIYQDSDFLLVEGVHGLLGLGPGLTPAGDDFLLGFLCGLAHADTGSTANIAAKLGNLLIQDAPRFTTSLSAEYLKYAGKGSYHQYVVSLINALKNGSDEDLEEQAQKLLTLGHSSGTDLMLGLVYGGKVSLYAGERGVIQ